MQTRKLMLLPVTCGLALAVACGGGDERETSRIDVTTEQEGTTGTTTTTTGSEESTVATMQREEMLLQVPSPSDAQTTERRLAEAAESHGMRILERIDLRQTLAMASQGGAIAPAGAMDAGTTGTTDATGTTGAADATGTTGATGTTDATGTQATGTAGTSTGSTPGTTGSAAPGAAGTTGATGTTGTAGTTGANGTTGTAGTTGATGTAGTTPGATGTMPGATGTMPGTTGVAGMPATWDPMTSPRSATLFLLQDPELTSQLLTQTRSYLAAMPVEILVVETQQGQTMVIYENPDALTQGMSLAATDPMGSQLQRAIEDIVQRATAGETAGIP